MATGSLHRPAGIEQFSPHQITITNREKTQRESVLMDRPVRSSSTAEAGRLGVDSQSS